MVVTSWTCVQLGGSTQTEQSPSQDPTQVAAQVPPQVPLQLPSHAPVHVPSQVPLQAPKQVPSAFFAAHVPAQVPLQFPVQVPEQVPEQLPLQPPPQLPVHLPMQVVMHCPYACPGVHSRWVTLTVTGSHCCSQRRRAPASMVQTDGVYTIARLAFATRSALMILSISDRTLRQAELVAPPGDGVPASAGSNSAAGIARSCARALQVFNMSVSISPDAVISAFDVSMNA